MRYLRTNTAALLIAALPLSAQAQDSKGFDPRQPCIQMMKGASETDQMMIASWVFGYLAAKQSDPRPVHVANNQVILRNLAKACAAKPQSSLLELVDGSKPGGANKPGSEAHARAQLMKFYAPNADLVALTGALRPTEADIRAVFGEPLAGRLVAEYGKLFKPGVKIGPKADHDDLWSVRATTQQLKNGDPVLTDFSGGHKQVRGFYIGDHPVVRFKFVTKGETLGLAFDGLFFVNGRWVLMPKPWRVM